MEQINFLKLKLKPEAIKSIVYRLGGNKTAEIILNLNGEIEDIIISDNSSQAKLNSDVEKIKNLIKNDAELDRIAKESRTEIGKSLEDDEYKQSLLEEIKSLVEKN